MSRADFKCRNFSFRHFSIHSEQRSANSHPYTKALLRSVPVLGLGDDQKLETIPGVTPNPADLKEGCEFADRCSECMEKCRKGKIPAFEVSPGHKVRCLKFDSYPEVK